MEREKAARSKSVAFKLSRRLVEKDERRIKDATDKLRDSLQGHAFTRDILGNKEGANNEEGQKEPLLGRTPKLSKDPEDEDSYDEQDEKEMTK